MYNTGISTEGNMRADPLYECVECGFIGRESIAVKHVRRCGNALRQRK